MSPNRRDVLRASGAAALLTGGLAGCTERVEEAVPGVGGPGYRDWLYDPGELFEASVQGFLSVDAAAYENRKGALPDEVTDGVDRATEEAANMDPDEFDRLTVLGAHDGGTPDEYGDERSVASVVATGSFDVDDLEDRLTGERDLTERGEYEGYTLYGTRRRWDPSQTNAVAVSKETVVGATANAEDREGQADGGGYGTPTGTPAEPPKGGVTAEAAVKLHVDAEAGSAPRLTEANDRLSTAAADVGGKAMVGAVALTGQEVRQQTGLGEEGREGESDITGAVRDLTEGLVGIAGSATAKNESGDVVLRLYYENKSEVGDRADTVEDLKADLEEESDAVAVPDVDVSTNGSSVVIKIRGDPSEFYDELVEQQKGDKLSSTAPSASFSFDYESTGGGAGTLTITHDGGDSIPADQLRIVAADGTPNEPWGTSGDVEAGVSVTVEAESSDTVRVVWTSPEGGDSATLGKWTGPDA